MYVCVYVYKFLSWNRAQCELACAKNDAHKRKWEISTVSCDTLDPPPPSVAVRAQLLAAILGPREARGITGGRGHLPCHGQTDDLEPALFEVVALGGEAVEGLGLGETEAGGRVCRPGAVVHEVAQQRDGGLGLHILEGRERAMFMLSVFALQST